jgi:hypothetical protein
MTPMRRTPAGRLRTRMLPAIIAVLAVLAVLAVPGTGPARAATLPPANGAWQSPLYPGYFSDLIATRTEVWAATREGGLVHLDRATGTLSRVVREPGGLASNELTSLALDRSGRLWVGTAGNGVSRLRADRSGWDVVNRIDGLPGDSVLTLTAVGDTVWIGTTRGLAFWNGRLISGSLPDPNTSSFDTTFSRLAITGIVQMGDTLWLATRGGVGLAHLSAALTDWRPVNTGIFGGLLDIEDLAWDGTTLAIVGQDYAHQFRFATGDWSQLGTPAVPNTVTGANGQLWLGTRTGVHRWTGAAYDSPPGSPLPFAKPFDPWPDYLRAVAAPDGAVFAGTGPSLYEYRAGIGWTTYDVPSPVDNGIIGLALDRGRVYASGIAGVSRWNGAAWRRWPTGPCSGAGCDTTFIDPTAAIGLFADSRGRKWVGAWSIALDRFDDDVSPPDFQHLARSAGAGDTVTRRTWTYSGAEDAAGRVWLGMDTPDDVSYPPLGITVYASDGTWLGAWSNANSNMAGQFVWALERDRYGRMWLGYKALGIDYITPNASGSPSPLDPAKFTHLAVAANATVRGFATHGDDMWVLSETHLQRYQLSAATSAPTLAEQIVFPSPGLAALSVHPLAAAPDGSVWAATADGLWHVVPGDTVHYTTGNSPLASNAVRSLQVDSTGAVWIGTVAGLQRFDPSYVTPPPPPQVAFHIRPYPNPATTTNLGIRLRLEGAPAGTSGIVYDIGGRRVRTFRITSESAVFWDGRDDDGTLVRPGVYFVRAAAGGQEAFARVVILH